MSDFDNNPYAASNITDDYDFQQQVPVPVPDYLVPSILVALICQPLGIIAIVFSALANGEKSAGNYQKAMNHAKNARVCLIIAGIGCVLVVLCLLAFTIISELLGIPLPD